MEQKRDSRLPTRWTRRGTCALLGVNVKSPGGIGSSCLCQDRGRAGDEALLCFVVPSK